MPVEPPAVPWIFPRAAELVEGGLEDLVAVGADLEPGTLLAAYRAGLFPMPAGPDELHWWSPDPRAVLPLDGLVVSRSLRRSCRGLEIRVDTAFAEVIAACADPRRPQGWIDSGIEAAYTCLHELGWAHSVETWRDGVLVGGLYGVAIGGLFAGESMFHRITDASKVALVGLVELLSDGQPRVLDVQWRTDHLASLGVVEVPRREYLEALPALLQVPLPAAFAS
ncbi:Leucyl/phenylalanyl-tRNA--protein transferase [metagenome]|uniref:Leucyl/phenylalanyl-tRNA--protein transferase n=1 Tax=metagenome TaxID=256318 RepID=A0A2P2CE97_9ZZZZ